MVRPDKIMRLPIQRQIDRIPVPAACAYRAASQAATGIRAISISPPGEEPRPGYGQIPSFIP